MVFLVFVAMAHEYKLYEHIESIYMLREVSGTLLVP